MPASYSPAGGLKTRKAGTAIPTSANFITHDAEEYNLISRRAQRLSRRFNIAADRARLIASLAFEVQHG